MGFAGCRVGLPSASTQNGRDSMICNVRDPFTLPIRWGKADCDDRMERASATLGLLQHTLRGQ